MPRFRSEYLDQLARQLTFTPPRRRRAQMRSIEKLYWQLDPERNYPLDYLVYAITGYRPDDEGSAMLTGKAARADLPVMVDRLSDSLEETTSSYDPPPMDLEAVARKLNVSGKSVRRYRQQGLFARRLIWPDGKKRLAFLPESVERFVSEREDKTHRAAGFARMDEKTRRRIVHRARRIASRVDVPPFRVARHLAGKYHRSTEAIRLLLLQYDREHPREPIFPRRTPPLTQKHRRVIHRALVRGVSVARLARRFGKTRDAIYLAANRQRAAVLRGLDIHYISGPTFEHPDAEEVILGSHIPLDAARSSTAHSSALDAQTERALFARYNFLKYLARRLRANLDPHHPRARELDRIETLLRWALMIKEKLVRAHAHLVEPVARRHLAASENPRRLDDLTREGERTLVRAVETFDISRGSRFSTYLTWILMRRFAAAHASARSRSRLPPLPATGHRGRFSASLLASLSESERRVIRGHLGIDEQSDDPAPPRTLAHLGQEMEISAAQARRIEQRAIRKLREAATRQGLALPTTRPAWGEL